MADKVNRIETDEVREIVEGQRKSSGMIDLVTPKQEGIRQLNREVITNWPAEIDRRRKRYGLTFPKLAQACGMSEDAVKKGWSKEVPRARIEDNWAREERSAIQMRRKVINLAYAMKLSRAEVDELLSKHAGYTRLLEMFDDDMVDIYLFEHRDLDKPVEKNEYNRRHDACMAKLNAMDRAGESFVMPEEDRAFLQYCMERRAGAENVRLKTIEFINSYIDSSEEKKHSTAFCRYMADRRLLRKGRRACRDWRDMSREDLIRVGKTACKEKKINISGYTEDELALIGKRNCEIPFDRDWLILLGLKLRMPRQLIDHMLKLSGNEPLYPKNMQESLLCFLLKSIIREQPSFFGINEEHSRRVIRQHVKEYDQFTDKDDCSTDVSLHQIIYKQFRKMNSAIGSHQDVPLWLDKNFLNVYEEKIKPEDEAGIPDGLEDCPDECAEETCKS